MARSKSDWTQAKFERYVKEGRGKGSGKHYKPWITIQDFPSKGRVSRSPGWKSDRVHHFMSDWELRFFYLLEWSDAVKDIKEQYPLLDLDLAFSIADEMGIKYPKDRKSDTPYVLTTDFMLTVKQGTKPIQIARTVKLAKELEKKRVLELLQLEQRYWDRQNIDWAVVTEQEISKIFADNIKWIHSAYKWELAAENNNENCYYLSNILKERLTTKKTKINTITTALDKEIGIRSGTSLSLFKHLIARKEIIVDMLETKLSGSSHTTIIKKVT
ncbi:MAG: TnsA endonuclease N-terminal domain-containing protein [Xenococcaceae cyanobacterium MO_188.B32]|nr:TnsA endonuclease N-terminal domain-containing protein [Xenococcaceae cyanobacterium MO_188.B32]